MRQSWITWTRRTVQLLTSLRAANSSIPGHQAIRNPTPFYRGPTGTNCFPLVGPTGAIEILELIDTGESMRFGIRLDGWITANDHHEG
jgi:hypothetical protein